MERKLRISQYKDYVAVDVVDKDGTIKQTPLNVTEKAPFKLRAYDFEECKWLDATIHLKSGRLSAIDETGLEWDVDPTDLLDVSQFNY